MSSPLPNASLTPAELVADPANWRALQQLQTQYELNPLPLSAINRSLRQAGFTGEIAAALTSQLELRSAAQSKFGEAARHMLFTRRHLEQATRLRVALLHAKRFADADVRTVADLGCGLGTESLACALLGLNVIAIDLDPEATACAAVNLRDFETAQVLTGDIRDFDVAKSGASGIFVDPARRDGKGRILDPEKWSPSWSTVLDYANGSLPLGAKLAPGIDRDLIPADFHAQWLSVDRNLVEATIWSPQLAPEGPGVSAAVLSTTGMSTLTGPAEVAPVGDLQDFLFEPDPAVIRSGLVGNLVNQFSGSLLHPQIAYGTAATATASPFAEWFEVLASTPLRVKPIRAALADFDAGTVEVKKRGASIDPATLQKQLKGSGTQKLVVIATRQQEKHQAIICRRIP